MGEQNAASEPLAKKEESSPTGGCSLGCASLFVLAAFVWPALHVIAKTYEPEVLMLSFLIGGPSFLIGNILAIIAVRSRAPSARRFGKWALRIMWAFVALFFVLALVGSISEQLSGK